MAFDRSFVKLLKLKTDQMKFLSTLMAFLVIGSLFSQSAVRGQLQEPDGEAIVFANVALYAAADSNLVKVETTDDAGLFKMVEVPTGKYFLKATYVGLADLVRLDLDLTDGQELDLGVLKMQPASTELEQVTVTTTRAMVEVKPDRMVFNVQGTINSVGENAISLLRKAPGVTVDNNENVNVLGRSGVLMYVDGKRLPLSGAELSGYLQSLTAEQIDRIDIISNPGAKYEAEGNAGIIDIRLKKDKNHGTNGTLSSTFTKSRFESFDLSGSANYRNKAMNIFASAGYGQRNSFNDMTFLSYQNDIIIDEINNSKYGMDNLNYRIGTDFFLNKKHTIGFLVSGGTSIGQNIGDNQLKISTQSAPTVIDSLLIAANTADFDRDRNTFNINYQFEISKDQSLNIDLDYGKYKNASSRFQPNRYFDATGTTLLTEIINVFDTPTDIDISTAKVDYENSLLGGKIGIGAKVSQVVSKNTFLFFERLNDADIRNDQRSNKFDYNENVYAAYLSYARPINQKWNFSAGLRAEQTDAIGELAPFDPALAEDPVVQDYLSLFPSIGFTYTPAREHTFNLNYGRRINRPDYQVLNPFENRLSELSFEKGNPTLRPEIVNNVELGYTLKYRFNFKLAYSITEDQITRLIAPDDKDPRAGFITWANLATQKVLNFNISAPMMLGKKWSMYTNLSASYIDNQADYGEGAIVDVQAFTYSIYQQHTFPLGAGFKGEISGYFSGPGVWGGVFKYNSNGALNLGLQKKFMKDKLNVKLAANDIFFTSGWNGVSEFNGLVSEGAGLHDSRRVSLSLSYNFGNQNVKSRKRKTGLEEEGKRVGN